MLFVFAQILKTLSPQKCNSEVPSERQIPVNLKPQESQVMSAGPGSDELLPCCWLCQSLGTHSHGLKTVSKGCGWLFKEQSPTPSLPSILSYFHKPSNDHHIAKFGAREGKMNIDQTAVSSNEANEAAFTGTDTGPDPCIT